MLRIGRIPYLNCEPFFAHLGGVELLSLTPRRLGEATAAGQVDAAPLSLMDQLRLEADLVPLPFGIANHGPVKSVLLFSRRPPGELAGAAVAVTDETSTSVEILRVLLHAKHKAPPARWVGPHDPADAVLLIGDQAIRTATSAHGWPHVMDLAQEWVDWTGGPCVFARWAIRRAVPAAEREAFAAVLETALARGLADLPAIARRRADTGFTAAEVIDYLSGFAFRFGPQEERAIAELRRRRAQLDPV
jgi:chorismate dehydratase